MQVLLYGNPIELVPEHDLKMRRGGLKGINTSFERDKDSAMQAIAAMKPPETGKPTLPEKISYRRETLSAEFECCLAIRTMKQ